MNIPFMIFVILAMIVLIAIGVVITEVIEGRTERNKL